MKLNDLSTTQLVQRAAGEGLCWRVGPFIVRLRTPLPDIVENIAFLYAGFPVLDGADYADHEVVVLPRGMTGKRVSIIADGRAIYPSEPRTIAVPLLEWTLNLCVFHQPSTNLILHAAVVERGGCALIMPAVPGSGKSTFCAALAHRGWRLLSDEVAILRRTDGRVVPATRPIGLKNASIDVIQQFAPEAVLGPGWPGTAKGTVAHCLPSEESIRRAGEAAQPRWLMFPAYRHGAETELTPISKPRALVHAAADSFNYSVLGTEGFTALSRLVDACDCYELTYGDLEDAVAVVGQWTQLDDSAQPEADSAESSLPAETPPSATRVSQESPAKIGAAPTRIRELLLGALRHPEDLEQLSPAEWDVLLRAARVTSLLSSLAVRVAELELLEKIPDGPRPHLEAARTVAIQHERIALWEVKRVERALMEMETPVVFLKGAAYLLAGCRFSRGRVITDVDILLPRQNLAVAESQFRDWGWIADEESPLDEQYYREWLHELPPLTHFRRGTSLDVHHTILPRTDRLEVRPELLFDEAVPYEEGNDQFLVLCPADMFLHAATHLFRNGDFSKGLRDLADLRGMLQEFATTEHFWRQLVTRAEQLDLAGPCYYALRYTARYFDCQIPDDVKQATRAWKPVWPPLMVMDRLVEAAVIPRYLDRIDHRRERAIGILARLYLPRFRVAASPSFWKKRMPQWFGPRKPQT